MTWLLLTLASPLAHAEEPLGTVSGVIDDRPWVWAVGAGGGAVIPLGGTARMWGPGAQIGGRLERNTQNGVSVEARLGTSSHGLRHPGGLIAGWGDAAPLVGLEQRTVAQGAVRWARPGRVEPSLAVAIGATWQATRLGVEGSDVELEQDLIWPNAGLSGALSTPLHGPLHARLSADAAATFGVDVGEVGPDSVFAAWALGSQLELVVRVPPR